VSRKQSVDKGVTRRVRGGSAGGRAAADEVNNLELVAVVEAGLSPKIARDDAAIQFHGDAVRFHAHLFEQGSQSERSVKIAVFPVNLKFHRHDAIVDQK